MICLLPHCGYLSETSRMLAIHRALVARGAEVVVATHGGTHERLLAAAGVSYDLVEPAMSDARCRRMVREGAGIGPPGQSMWSDEELLASARAEAHYFLERRVRVAVTGFNLPALLSTRLAGIPLATEHAGAYVPPMWEQRRFGAPLVPGMPGVRWLPAPLRRWFANLGTNRVALHCAGFNRVARELAVEGVPSFAQLLLGDISIVTEIPEVLGITSDDIRNWQPTQPGYRPSTRLHPGGPIFAEFDVPVPSRVETYLSTGGPVVYVALTSTADETVRGVVRALRSMGVKILVAGTVHVLDDLADDGVLVEGVLPSHRIMPRVDLAITTGGQGSVQCAMASGTPLIALPLHPEQDLNGFLIERLGAGHRMTVARASSPAVGRLVARMLDTPSYRAAARNIAAQYATVDGPGIAADTILAALR